MEIEVVLKLKTMTTLGLSYNSIGPEGAIIIGEALKVNFSIAPIGL